MRSAWRTRSALASCNSSPHRQAHRRSWHTYQHQQQRFTSLAAQQQGHMAPASPPQQQRCSVAVIGAGAAGLVAVRELLREGHAVTAFEAGATCGGTWRYTPEVEEGDLLGQGSTRRRVHSSMYRDLRTNLPREVMGYTDFPFTPATLGPRSADPRRFPSHTEVLTYLEAFADAWDLHQHIQYDTAVTHLEPLWPRQQQQQEEQQAQAAAAALGSKPSPQGDAGATGATAAAAADTGSCRLPGPRWRVTTLSSSSDSSNSSSSGRDSSQGPQQQHLPQQQPKQHHHQQQQEFDAVVVCNGHYAAPWVPPVPGVEAFPGQALHSHNYRAPEPYAGQRVLVIGASNSGEDICRELSPHAAGVYLSGRSWANPEWDHNPAPFGPAANIHRRGLVTRVSPDGTAEFSWGDAAQVDAIIFATGYRYEFPFLETTHLVSTEDKHVAPLYCHLFVPSCGPRLSFLGLPWKVVPFPLCEIQARYVARLLSGRAALPSEADMAAAAHQEQQQQAAAGIAPEYYHRMGGELQWEYCRELLAAAGLDSPEDLQQLLPDWRRNMYASTGANKRAYPETYRDHWDDAESAAAAAADLEQRAEALQQLQGQHTGHGMLVQQQAAACS